MCVANAFGGPDGEQELPNGKTRFGKQAKKVSSIKAESLVATPAGIEPATFSLEGCCSIP